MQDSGLSLCRLLADQLQIGVILVDDAGICRFANERACELLGAADEASARAQWSALRNQIAPGTPRAAPLRQAVDVTTVHGVRRLRAEAHALPDNGGYAVLVRDRAAIAPSDHLPMLATRAQADCAVLSGLVHAASGPLNNFNLTLAVMDAGIEPFDASPQAAAACARFRRHLGVLRSEAASLVSTLDELRALSDRRSRDPVRIDVAECVRDVARWLRQEAVVRGAAIAADAPTPAWIVADRETIALGLIALASRMLEACGPGSVVRLLVEQAGERNCIVRIAVEPVGEAASLADELFTIRPNPQDPTPATARTIIEAHGGVLSFECDARQCTVIVALPTA